MKFDLEQIRANINKRSYQFIGAGSGRAVFDLNNGYVVKVAKNRKGLAQNEAEYKIFQDDDKQIFAKIKQISDDYVLLIVEKADKVRKISQVWDYFHVRNSQELFHLDQYKDLHSKHSLVLNDLVRASNWGLINSKPVIVDYGFTHGVRRKYY